MAENRIYVASTSHLDTVWRWELPKTIEEFLPDTFEKNFDLIEKYPEYRFNFEGAYRYELIEEFYPEAFEKIKEYVEAGRWCPSGSEYENGDVNIPSPEALLRNILYGNRYFKEKFGVTTTDIYLPDCFGFGWALPSVMRHAGLNGFTTQKLGWGGAIPTPFDIGIWRGVDGSEVFASLKPFSYRRKITDDVRGDVRIIDKLANNGLKYDLPWTECLYGTGDWGGAPDEDSAKNLNASVFDNRYDENTKVISARTDEIFNDLEKLPKKATAALPVYDGELLMRSHGAGGYTSRTMSKRLNSQNEVLADYCEKAALTASLLTSYKYPQKNIEKAWKRVIAHQFHDDIPGTSTMLVYNDSWNDYFASLSQFRGEYEAAVGALANELDTSWCEECAVIVNNPVAARRKEAVEANVKLRHNASHVAVFDENGKEVPSQLVKKQGKELDIVFLADVPSVGFKVYDVRASKKAYSKKTDLVVTEHELQNSRYYIRFNRNGDIASILDKKLSEELLSKPIKLAALRDIGMVNYPSWELRKEDIDAEPIAYANTPEFEIVENGAARIAVKITRHLEHTRIIQVVSLASDSETIRVDNFIDWQERRTMLKAQFPFTCSNIAASYDLGLGYIRRPNNSDTLYEVPAQKWADITNEDNSFGISVFSDCKYGWDKPDGNTLRLTCLHTPAGAFTKDARQDLQDIGRNYFSFGIYAHKGALASGTQLGAECFVKKLTAFQTSSRREGALKSSFSALKISSAGVLLRAFKLAEDGNGIIVRFNEGCGKARKGVMVNMPFEIIEAVETDGQENTIGDAKVTDGALTFDIKAFGLKTFKLKVKTEPNKATEKFKKLELEYNTQGITKDSSKVNVILQGSGCSLPNELLSESVTVNGITFKLPNADMEKNLFVMREQQLEIPKGMTKLYMLAASTIADRDITILADNKERKLTVHAMCEPVGLWDMEGLDQKAKVKDGKLAIEFTHTHHPEGNLANRRAYFFIYEIDVRNCKTLTFPEENRVAVLAMTAVKRFSSTRLATKLTDTVEEIDSISAAPIEKIIEKADFVSIQAGRYVEQSRSGKGKGFKRDNVVTNIVRSFTKSEW
ncbi:MAG: alpha-mannosidase [Eubacterium sp.]|nr:alpha-mannosidase [Eubacterium sp.]